jgi:hypothetical protein
MRAPLLAAMALALALCAGCRFAVYEIHDGLVPDPEKVAGLATGRTTLDEALATLGAPDRVEWLEEQYVIVYASTQTRRTRWERSRRSRSTDRSPDDRRCGSSSIAPATASRASRSHGPSRRRASPASPRAESCGEAEVAAGSPTAIGIEAIQR